MNNVAAQRDFVCGFKKSVISPMGTLILHRKMRIFHNMLTTELINEIVVVA